jgi:hypothetical protein
MTRALLCAALALWAAAAGLAHAQSGAMMLMSGSTVSAPPPPPPPPAGCGAVPSVLAGRTDLQNCVKFYDFSSSKYATQSNYLVAYGHGGINEWYEIPNCGVGPTPPSSSNISQVFDSAAGVNVLQLHWNAADFFDAGGCNRQVHEIVTEKPDLTATTSFPPNSYIEASTALDIATPGVTQSPCTDPQGDCGWELAAFWQWTSRLTASGTGDAIERDFLNYFYHNGAQGVGYISQSIGWPFDENQNGRYAPSTSDSTPGAPPISNATVYHTIGIRTTSNGSSQIHTCYYLDGTAIPGGCGFENTSTYGSGFNPFVTRGYLILQVGPTTYNYNYKIKYIKVWTCQNWQQPGTAGQCNGTVLTN